MSPFASPTVEPHEDDTFLPPRVVTAMPDMCAVCATTVTPEWRKGPAGLRSLCNGCGITYAKRVKEHESRGAARLGTVEEIERELEAVGLERFKVRRRRASPLPLVRVDGY